MSTWVNTGTGQPLAPYQNGDAVLFVRHADDLVPCTVLAVDRDAFGWDVLVLPDGESLPFWVGDNRLTGAL